MFFQEGSTLGLHLGYGHFRPASGGIGRILPKNLPHLKAGLLQGPWSLGQSQPMHQVRKVSLRRDLKVGQHFRFFFRERRILMTPTIVIHYTLSNQIMLLKSCNYEF